MQKTVITNEDITTFIEGKDDMERIVNLSYKYDEKFMTIFYRNENDQKCVTTEPFKPFCWATLHACKKLCKGNRAELSSLLKKYNIGVKKLSNTSINGEVITSFEEGYMYMFFAKEPMSYQRFLSFFKEGKNPVYAKKDKNGNDIITDKADERQYLIVTPQEQFLISTGKRFFKGYIDYDEVYRMIFDLETEGLDPKRHRITDLGIRTNRGFERLFKVRGETKEELDFEELKLIDTMLRVIYTFKPDVITAHNGENFDWNFLIVRCEMLGTSMEQMSAKYFNGESIKKEDKESVLKLGGEMEKFRKTIVPNTIVTDSLHAVRRAQAIDSNMLRADLKYATKYAKMVKPNRVYIPGDKINSTGQDTEYHYAFNNIDGDWYLITDKTPLKEGYEIVNGTYIVDRYLLDDIWECDKVEHKFNTTNFLICKLLPVPYSKCTTMGTAGQWKALMMAWSYENDIAIPKSENTGSFTGGLSRLLCTGYVSNVIKLDYNSLYPSIILTWGISDDNDLMGAMLKFLEYVLTEREKYKGLKKKAGKIVDKLKGKVQDGTATQEEIEEYKKASAEYAFNDKKQAQMKVFGNSFFGSYGSNNGSVFPWKSPKCAEQTTCTGRQSLRLMISHFSKLGYRPIVGDSVSGDTPLIIKYSNGCIDIKPICEIFDYNGYDTDEYGREYDVSEKPYKVLCRSGWVDVEYVYRHHAKKDMYRVTNDSGAYVDVTEDHSLFTDDKKEIKPSEINEDTVLESKECDTYSERFDVGDDHGIAVVAAHVAAMGVSDRVSMLILNSNRHIMSKYYETFMEEYRDDITYSKTLLAGLKYIKNKINGVF